MISHWGWTDASLIILSQLVWHFMEQILCCPPQRGQRSGLATEQQPLSWCVAQRCFSRLEALGLIDLNPTPLVEQQLSLQTGSYTSLFFFSNTLNMVWSGKMTSLMWFPWVTLPPGGHGSSLQLRSVRARVCLCVCSSCSAHGEPLSAYCLRGCLCVFSALCCRCKWASASQRGGGLHMLRLQLPSPLLLRECDIISTQRYGHILFWGAELGFDLLCHF